MDWQETCAPNGMYGRRRGRGADQCAIRTALELAMAGRTVVTAGDALDFRKCFDLIPIYLAIDIAAYRGAPSRWCNGLRNFYRKVTRRLKLRGYLGELFGHDGSLFQGSLSSLVLVKCMGGVRPAP